MGKDWTMEAETIIESCRTSGTRLIRFLYCDHSGIIRGKAVSSRSLPGCLEDGIGLPIAMTAANNLDRIRYTQDIGPIGEVRLVADLDSFSLLPYVPRNAAFCCDIYDLAGLPWSGCARSFLKRMRQKAADRGLQFRAAFEVEFTLAHRLDDGRYVPFDETLTYSSIAMTMAANIVDAIIEALEAQGIEVEQYYPECAYGLHEITVAHREVLEAADNHVRLRETIRGVAWKHGLYASFAPKLWPEVFGIFAQNSAHIHFSLWDDKDSTVFCDSAAPNSLSHLGRQFLAGILVHLPALTALTCPSVNSYRRLQQRGNICGAFAAYGLNNREAALRIVPPSWNGHVNSLNVELRPVDSSCNPYLALGSILAAGLDGVDRDLELGPPLDVNPVKLEAAQLEEMAVVPLPSTLDDALASLQSDAVIVEALGSYLADLFVSIRQFEADAYRDKDAEFEFANHFYKY